jgi:NDP-sugar pyrophosphorylase family protein
MLPTLVLCAGLGTRLDPLTRLLAKPAVPLAGKTLVERVLEGLERQGVRDVVVNLSHRPETIARILGDGAQIGLRVRYSWEQPVLGSAGGPRRALPLLDADTFLIVNGDTLSDVAIAPMLEAHRANGADVTMAVVPNPRPDHYNGIVLDDRDRVTGFAPRGQAGGSWHFIGVQIVRAAVFADIPDGTVAETVAGIYRERLAQAPGTIRGWRVTTPFIDVGTPRDYLDAALSLVGRDGAQRTIDATARIDASARLTRSIVWAGAAVAAAADLDECIVTSVSVPPGLRARSAAILPASALRAGDAAEIRNGVAVFQF